MWIGKDFAGGTSLFGGGGYLINPGRGNRNVWQVAVALTHDLSKDVSIGAEVTQQGPGAIRGTSQPARALERSSTSPARRRCLCQLDPPGQITKPAIISAALSGLSSKARSPARERCRELPWAVRRRLRPPVSQRGDRRARYLYLTQSFARSPQSTHTQ